MYLDEKASPPRFAVQFAMARAGMAAEPYVKFSGELLILRTAPAHRKRARGAGRTLPDDCEPQRVFPEYKK